MPNLFQTYPKISRRKISLATAADHAIPAVHPGTGDICTVFTQASGGLKSVYVAIERRITEPGATVPMWSAPTYHLLGAPSAAVYGGGGANESCENPWACPIEDGFAVFWLRRNTSISITTMTIGASLEMAKLLAPVGHGSYTKYASDTAGKGFVLDNQIIHGAVGVMPRCAWFGKNLVGVVYGHQTSYAVSTPWRDREVDLRAAYLDFTTNGKPVLTSASGNRTGGSVSDAKDGGFAAGSSTSLVTGIDLDDGDADPNKWFDTAGCLLPSIVCDPRGDAFVAFEAFDRTPGATSKGRIHTYLFLGPRRGTELAAGALDSETGTTHEAGTNAYQCRRPILACRWPHEYGAAVNGANFNGVLLAYAEANPVASGSNPTLTTAKFKTIAYPLSGSLTEVVAAVTVGANSNYDATQDEQGWPTVADSPFLSCAVIKEWLNNTGSGIGRKMRVVHSDGTQEFVALEETNYPHRPALAAVQLRDGTKIAVMTYEGSNDDVAASREIYHTIWKF